MKFGIFPLLHPVSPQLSNRVNLGKFVNIMSAMPFSPQRSNRVKLGNFIYYMSAMRCKDMRLLTINYHPITKSCRLHSGSGDLSHKVLMSLRGVLPDGPSCDINALFLFLGFCVSCTATLGGTIWRLIIGGRIYVLPKNPPQSEKSHRHVSSLLSVLYHMLAITGTILDQGQGADLLISQACRV